MNAPTTDAGYRRTNTLLDLTCIFDSQVQVASWPRPLQPEVQTYLAEAARLGRLGQGLRQRLAWDQPPDLSDLPDLPGRPALAKEVAELCMLYGDLLGCPYIGMRIEVVEGAMCPRFHVDRTGIRLVCTWRGSGTEWLDDARLDRSRLGIGSGGTPDEESGLLPADITIHQADNFELVLLKGSLWQGNQGQGAIHRSPAVVPEHSPRVLIALDALWE
ncbi:MAG: DUF1826 domain-containing protein [Rhodocyclaceae bacterium]|nr:MAG: DUF1826 domain-containing protein [Rhodocyclaceae bacterium]